MLAPGAFESCAGMAPGWVSYRLAHPGFCAPGLRACLRIPWQFGPGCPASFLRNRTSCPASCRRLFYQVFDEIAVRESGYEAAPPWLQLGHDAELRYANLRHKARGLHPLPSLLPVTLGVIGVGRPVALPVARVCLRPLPFFGGVPVPGIARPPPTVRLPFALPATRRFLARFLDPTGPPIRPVPIPEHPASLVPYAHGHHPHRGGYRLMPAESSSAFFAAGTTEKRKTAFNEKLQTA